MRSSSLTFILTFILFFVLAACGSDKNGNLDDFTACGEYETTFTTSDSVMVTLSGADLASEIQGLCDSAVIADPNRCEALQAAANMAGDIEVSVAVAKLENAAARTVDVDFDNAYCLMGLKQHAYESALVAFEGKNDVLKVHEMEESLRRR